MYYEYKDANEILFYTYDFKAASLVDELLYYASVEIRVY